MIVMIVMMSILILIISCLIFGNVCESLLEKKGYKNYKWVGYVLGSLGMLWCAGLPDLKNRQLLKNILEKLDRIIKE